jgi:acetylornithine/N-succinyldiaminopimelate aminotransferase
MPVYPRCNVRPIRGEGCWLIGQDGRRYLDFAGGIAVNALGHSHPGLIKAIQDQAATLMHVSNLYGSPQGEAVAQRLVDHTFADTVFFTNSGAEAVECAIKTARRYHVAQGRPERHTLITFSDAFHGRTLGAISATDQPKLRDGFAPLLPGFAHARFNDLASAEALIDESTAGFLVEPIQGEGGVRPASREFLRGLRRLCDERGLLLVLDEVQTGVGRCGVLYAHEAWGIHPDIMATAKGLGGGFPMGACLATKEAAQGMGLGTHGSTYGGNPLAMAAAGAVLDVVLAPGFLEQVRETGRRLTTALTAMADHHGAVFDHVRGMGLMLGIKLRVDARAFVAHARDHHQVLTVTAGDNVMRVLPPLIIGQAEINDFVLRISDAAASYRAQAA